MKSSCEPTGPRHHGGCRSADASPTVTTMPTLQLLNSCTHVGKQCWKHVGRSTNLQFPYCWRACPFTMMMSVVSKAHRPGNAIMMAVNGLAPKGHQYTSEHHSESSAILVYSSSLKPCYTTYIPHYSHWTRNVKGSSVGWQPAWSFVVGRIGFSHR